MVEGFRDGILNGKFKEMSVDISRTDLESFINFEDRLNNFWSHKVYRVLLEKRVGQNE